MAHLKKLSDRLSKKFYPRALDILRIDNPDIFAYAETRESHGVTKRVKQFVVPSLKMTAAHNGIASLSAAQVGINSNAFVMHKDLIDNQWNGYKSLDSDYAAFVDVWIKDDIPSEPVEEWEQCASMPGIEAKCKRAKDITATYRTVEGRTMTKTFEDFPARVFQHQHDYFLMFFMINYSISSFNVRYTKDIEDSRLMAVLDTHREEIEHIKRMLEQKQLHEDA